ncbi:hypothetical protein VNI00_016093 [Paramarasmius palmivorus]|uniref:Uncharacterized protein n=1 Tax=Paramarasmius palmivorus TaxID=297713 RepID=A0AAW0BHS8_9AGAR
MGNMIPSPPQFTSALAEIRQELQEKLVYSDPPMPTPVFTIRAAVLAHDLVRRYQDTSVVLLVDQIFSEIASCIVGHWEALTDADDIIWLEKFSEALDWYDGTEKVLEKLFLDAQENSRKEELAEHLKYHFTNSTDFGTGSQGLLQRGLVRQGFLHYHTRGYTGVTLDWYIDVVLAPYFEERWSQMGSFRWTDGRRLPEDVEDELSHHREIFSPEGLGRMRARLLEAGLRGQYQYAASSLILLQE